MWVQLNLVENPGVGKMSRIESWSKLSERFSLIPLKGKVPIEPGWQRWCEEKRIFNPKEFEGNNAGVACGPASGVLVVDIDHSQLFKQILSSNNWTYDETFTVRTGADRYHLYFKYPNNGGRCGCTSYKTEVMGISVTVFDVRGCGGQVVGPESIHPVTNKPYKIVRDIEFANPPVWLIDLVKEKHHPKPPSMDAKSIRWGGNIDELPISEETKDAIHNGRNVQERSEAIMSVCNALVWANLNDSQIFEVFDQYPIGDKYREKGRNKERWLQKHIDKARSFITDRADVSTMSTMSTGSTKVFNVNRNPDMSTTRQQDVNRNSERNLLVEIKDWIEEADGKFTVGDVDKDLYIRTRQEKVHRGKILERLVKDGKIERFGTARGHYQTIDGNCPLINFINVDSTRSNLTLPFDLHNLFYIQPKNIIILAGDSNAGKTACMLFAMYSTINTYLQTKKQNQEQTQKPTIVNYYSSEMGPAEWNRRLSATGIPLDWWAQTCNIFQRSDNFHQVMNPNAISFVDYLEIHEDFYRVGGMIKAIFDKLDQGVAVISVQKNRGSQLGLGGNRGMEKSRLYLTIRESEPYGFTMTIEKGKNPIGTNKSHHECEFRIVDGWKLHQETPWERIKEDKRNA
jgi:hypothetical protein